MRRRYLGAAVLVVSLLAAACGGNEGGEGTASGKPEYKVGLIGALTGDNAQLVIHANNALRLAIDQANKKGDVPVKLALEAEDSQGDKDKAVPLAQKLAADDKVLAVVGPAFSGESFSSNPILQQAGIPQITQSATNPGLSAAGWKLWFRGVGNDNSQGGPAPDVFLTYLKAKKVFIGHDKSAYGEGLATIVRDGLKAKSASALAGFDAIDPGKKDYSALAAKVVSSQADVFFWGGYSPEGGLIVKQAREKGFNGTFVGADGSKDTTFLTTGGSAAEGAIHLCPCADVASATDPDSKAFVADYKAKFNEDPGIYAGEAYDVAQIIWAAIKKAGKPGSDIKAYRAQLGANIAATAAFKGLTKVYSFQPNGELATSAVTIYLYKVVNGKFTLLGRVSDVLKP
jgi:branched-chain amino acid transport system substrate-binding protein